MQWLAAVASFGLCCMFGFSFGRKNPDALGRWLLISVGIGVIGSLVLPEDWAAYIGGSGGLGFFVGGLYGSSHDPYAPPIIPRSTSQDELAAQANLIRQRQEADEYLDAFFEKVERGETSITSADLDAADEGLKAKYELGVLHKAGAISDHEYRERMTKVDPWWEKPPWEARASGEEE
jgi:hypothetical protein